MKHLATVLRDRVFPPIPAEIADDFAVMRATRVRSQTPLLFLTLFVTTPAAIYAASPGAWAIVQIRAADHHGARLSCSALPI